MGKYNKFQHNQNNQQKNMQDLKDAVENMNSTNFSNQSSFENMDNGQNSVRDAEVQTDGDSKWPDVLGIAIVALLLIGIVTTAIGKDGDNKSQVANTGSSIESEEEMESKDMMDDSVLTVSKVNEDGSTSDVQLVSKTSAPVGQISNVKLALLGESGKVQGVTRGCDVVFMVDRPISPTQAPLNSAIRELFKKDSGIDSSAGNFIATQSKLNFDKATLENGVASIFLTGEVGPYSNDCDNERTFIQIRETALQFTTVQSVVFYLDGKKLDN